MKKEQVISLQQTKQIEVSFLSPLSALFNSFKKSNKKRFLTKIKKQSIRDLILIIEENRYDSEVQQACKKELGNFKKKKVLSELNNY